MSTYNDYIDNAGKALAKKIDEEIMWDMLKQANWYQIEIPFEKASDSYFLWNEACAWAMEEFGLPGKRYITHIGKRGIEFLFKDEKDAILMTLKWL